MSLLIASQSASGRILVIRFLPAPERKNWTRSSGPVIHFDENPTPEQFVKLVHFHFSEFDEKAPPNDSEYEKWNEAKRREFFASCKFVRIDKVDGDLAIYSSEVNDRVQCILHYYPTVDLVRRVKPPWEAQELWKTLKVALDESKGMTPQ